jgi:hypothetical protein
LEELAVVRNVFDDETVCLKIIAQHGRESRLIFDREDPWRLEKMIRKICEGLSR